MDFTVENFRDSKGRVPTQEFLSMLKTGNPVLRKLTIASLKKIKNRHNHGFPLTEYVEKDLYTVRIGGNDIARVFFTFLPNWKIVTFNGFVKKRQKIPTTDLNKARKYCTLLKGS